MLITPPIHRIFTAGALCLALIIAGCKKEVSQSGSPQVDTNFTTISSQSDADAAAIFDDVFDNVMGVNAEVALGETGVFGRVVRVDSISNPCFTVTITQLNSPGNFPVQITIDFGAGCTGRDGRIRKGKIITVYTGRLVTPGKIAETTFDSYFVNDFHVEGVLQIKNTSTSQALVFSIIVKNGKLTKSNGNFTQWNAERTVTQVDGLGTPYWPKDDVFSIEGTANGSVKNDAEFFNWESEIIDPLIKKFICHYLVAGKLNVTRVNAGAAFIDYGTGECDNKATLIINGLSKEITLH